MKPLVYLIKYAYIFFATFTHTKALRKQAGLDSIKSFNEGKWEKYFSVSFIITNKIIM